MNIAESMNIILLDLLLVNLLFLGGSHGRESATAQGVTICIREAAKRRSIQIEGARVVIQGFGNAGSFLPNSCMMLEQKLLVFLMLMVHS